jgi:hypothetical protein
MAPEGWQPSNHIVTTISSGLWSNVKRDVKLFKKLMVSLISTKMHEKIKVQNDCKWIFFPGGDTIMALTLSSQKKSLDEKKKKKKLG